jgi:hypothetical protein
MSCDANKRVSRYELQAEKIATNREKIAQRLNGSQLAAGELARLAQLTHPLLFIRFSTGLPSLRSGAACNFVARSGTVN